MLNYKLFQTNDITAFKSFILRNSGNDWDKTMFTNTPGQSGDSRSEFYKNLFELWANDTHFPVYFSREKIEKSSKEKVIYTP